MGTKLNSFKNNYNSILYFNTSLKYSRWKNNHFIGEISTGTKPLLHDDCVNKAVSRSNM